MPTVFTLFGYHFLIMQNDKGGYYEENREDLADR